MSLTQSTNKAESNTFYRANLPLGTKKILLSVILISLLFVPGWFGAATSNLVEYPATWIVPLNEWTSNGIYWLVNDFDLGLFTFKEFTRGISWLLTRPFILAEGILVSGFSFGSENVVVPPLSWMGVLLFCVLLALRIGTPGLALGVGLSLLYMAVFGLWESAMTTLASVSVAVPLGVFGGLAIGVLAHRNGVFAKILNPILDIMQTMPIFAYLVPVLFFFGFGPVAALTATIVYALPPMVRITRIALEQVPKEISEAGTMAGCTEAQMLRKVLLPSALPSLLVGVNQVIMLSLTVVIIASMIGAGGLGYDVLTALRRLSIGQGLEAGLAITLMAIVMDRFSQAAAQKSQVKRHENPRLPIWVTGWAILAALLLPTILSNWIAIFAAYPEELILSTARFWDDAVTWININLYDTLSTIKYGFLINVMLPVKQFMHSLPWSGVVLFVGALGFILSGWRLGLTVAALVFFLAMTGNWEKSMTTVYLVSVGVVLSFVLGFPVGLVAVYSERARGAILVAIDTLQTLPSFVYLIPVVMLFENGDFAALIAIVAYAIVPSIRYTEFGIRSVSKDLVEASDMMGCTRWQAFLKVKLPLAFPEIMLGVNQTIMMALSMLIITALVGTRDLGQEVLNALQKADPGRGLVAGLCVAFIAIIADRLIKASADRMRRRMSGQKSE
ncbi:ABC transporter permease [Ruegeria atlantica]|uniref:ABC transporter permease n=1 Tax=Ruegeria atlantica TaxID=81569 RepID=UPI00147B2BE9|nr:ABC transporter permease subunit [Ruegeria atlantica]